LSELLKTRSFEDLLHVRQASLIRIYSINRKMSFLHTIEGIDLSRGFEYTQAYTEISQYLAVDCLDIGSYRSPFPIFIADEGYHVTVVDLSLSIVNQRRWAGRVLEETSQFRTLVADGRQLPFADASFDVVTAISVVEHIPEAGEKIVMSNIARVLRCGGRIFLSVPYAVVPRQGKWGKWYQQWFSYDGAIENLVKPSGLELITHGFMLGGKVGRLADLWYRLPRQVRHSLSWLHVLFLPRLFAIDEANNEDARVLWLVLGKA